MMWIAVLVVVTVAIPCLYVFLTWEHDIVRTLLALPAPNDFGTKEFELRCEVSRLTRMGWQFTISQIACPRITLQAPFELLPNDFALLTTCLGLNTIELDKVPFMFPQILVSCLFVQLFGNSNFPASVHDLKLKAVNITYLRPIQLQFEEEDPELREIHEPTLNCLMVLHEKRFVENAIEFAIQTDLIDQEGTLWQSTTYYSVAFHEKNRIVPVEPSNATLKTEFRAQFDKNAAKSTWAFACSRRNYSEFRQLSTTRLAGSSRIHSPLMWTFARVAAEFHRKKQIPSMPFMCHCSFQSEQVLPIEQPLVCSSMVTTSASQSSESSGQSDAPNSVLCFAVGKTQTKKDDDVLVGMMRKVGWRFLQEDVQ